MITTDDRPMTQEEMRQLFELWKDRAQRELARIENLMRGKNVPVLRGTWRDEGGVAIIDVDQLDDTVIEAVANDQSLCVVEFGDQFISADGEVVVDDLHIYLRLGQTSTWLHFALSAPDFDEDGEDASWPFSGVRPALSFDKQRLDEMALQLARSDGFSSLRNRNERRDLADSLLAGSFDRDLTQLELDEIAKCAESLFILGLAPERAKALKSDGKSLKDIANILGLTTARVERALATATPAHILRILERR